jgi:hypothetical protein
MTTVRQIKKLVAPLLARHGDLALVKDIIVVRPVHHLLRFVLIDRTSDANEFNPRWSVTYLFRWLDHLPLGRGEVLYRPGPGLWWLSDPEISEMLVKVVERDALPKLRGMRTLQDYLDFIRPEEPEELEFTWEPRFFISIALGDLDTTRGLLA